MVMAKMLRISRGGQLSVPAAVRKRWGTSTVVAEDHGDHLVVRPAPDDPVEAAFGALRAELEGEPPAAELVRVARDEDLRAEASRRGRRRRAP